MEPTPVFCTMRLDTRNVMQPLAMPGVAYSGQPFQRNEPIPNTTTLRSTTVTSKETGEPCVQIESAEWGTMSWTLNEANTTTVTDMREAEATAAEGLLWPAARAPWTDTRAAEANAADLLIAEKQAVA